MKLHPIFRIVIFFLFVHIQAAWAALPSLSPESGKVIVNEINLEAMYIELYFNEDADINNWELWINEQGSSGGGTTQYGCTLSGVYESGRFLLVPQEIGCSFELHQNTNEVLLLDSAGQVVHYVSIWHAGHEAKEWPYDGNESFATVLDDASGANPEAVCSKPNGEEAEGDWGVYEGGGTDEVCYPTPGLPNDFFDSNPFGSNHVRSFAKLFQTSAKGNIKIFGNTLLGERQCKRTNVFGQCTQWFDSATCPSGTTSNNSITTYYFDLDGDSDTFNSSSADLNLPMGATVLFAKLYWQGYLITNDSARKISAAGIKLKLPGDTAYRRIYSSEAAFNWIYYGTDGGSDRFYYQGSADITNKIPSEGSGTYWVADLVTDQLNGTNANGGNFGAWGIVIVYEYYGETFKNITVYDGYKAIANTSDASKYADADHVLSVGLSGFLTPTTGQVNSTFLFFVGEGDSEGPGDTASLTNADGDEEKLGTGTANPENNIMNSSITDNGNQVTARNPQCTNTIGVDIDTFSVGNSTNGLNIIQNSQTATTVTLTTDGDGYFPGVFAFATDLYVPDVCYEESITLNGEVPESIIEGAELDVNVTISNVGEESALGVSISRYFDDKLEYVADSTLLNSASKTDAAGDDTVTYIAADRLLKVNMGSGATVLEGGTLAYGETQNLEYKIKAASSGTMISEYKVSYRDESRPEDHVEYEEVSIGKCSDRSVTTYEFSVKASGEIRVVPTGGTLADEYLVTQKTGETLEFDLLFTDSTGALRTDSPVAESVELVDHRSGEVVHTWSDVHADNTGRATLDAFLAVSAHREVYFRVVSSGKQSTSNSFSIRPENLNIQVLAAQPMQAGRTYSDRLQVWSVAGYDQQMSNITEEARYYLRDGSDAGTVGGFSIAPVSFDSANPVWADINYSDVGRIELSLKDTEWTLIDADNDLCVKNSCSNERDASGRIGCSACGTADSNLSFIPDHFAISFLTTPALDDNATFTYFSNDLNMSARLDNLSMTVTAENYQNQTTPGYTDRLAGGYEEDITMHFEANVSTMNMTLGFTAQDANFTDGSAGVTVESWRMNPGKNRHAPKNPWQVTGNDVNLSVSVTDSNAVGGETSLVGVDGSATYFYARINPLDISCQANQPCFPAIDYEVYCRGCDRTALGIDTWNEAVNDVFWYVNPNHQGSEGNVSGSDPAFVSAGSVVNGRQNPQYLFTTPGTYRVKIDYDADHAPEYLFYDPYSNINVSSFSVTVTGAAAGGTPNDVVNNAGTATPSRSRIGE